jgi:hypothetical protein
MVDIVSTYGIHQSQQELENCIKGFFFRLMEVDSSQDIKEWMSKVKKPQNMTVQDFVDRLSHLDDLIDYMPIPNPISDPGVQLNSKIYEC